MAELAEPPPEINNIFRANFIDFTNRLTACQSTPLVNPDSTSLFLTEYSFRPDQKIIVVRDDILCGGSKSRVAFNFVRNQILNGYTHFVYISPWYGAASVALPWILRVLQKEFPDKNLECTIIIDKYPLKVVGEYPPYIIIGAKYGAKIIEVPINEDKFRFAQEYAQKNNALFLEPGFNYPEVISDIGNLVEQIKERYGFFDEAWCAIGSGTLIRGLQNGNIAQNYFGVCIFKYCPYIENAVGIFPEYHHNEPIPLNEIPPFPSALYYDSKVWKYIKDRPGKILFWNVA